MEADRKAKAVSCLRGRPAIPPSVPLAGKGAAVKRGAVVVVLVKGLWVAACRSINATVLIFRHRQ